MIIAIDGPSGSGKSTLGRMLARALKLLYIDTARCIAPWRSLSSKLASIQTILKR